MLHDLGCVLLCEALDLGDFVEEFSSLNVLCDEVKVAFVLVELEEPDDVGVVQLLQDLDLVCEALQVLLGDVLLPDDLHRSDLAVGLQLDLLDLAEGALADLLKNPVLGLDLALLLMDEDGLIDLQPNAAPRLNYSTETFL